ncbi:MAG: hypothetical protein ACREJV_07110, partial [Candidatus Rokuibacteriota bacterium]
SAGRSIWAYAMCLSTRSATSGGVWRGEGSTTAMIRAAAVSAAAGVSHRRACAVRTSRRMRL